MKKLEKQYMDQMQQGIRMALEAAHMLGGVMNISYAPSHVEQVKVKDRLSMLSVKELDLTPKHRVRVINCLIHAGEIHTLGQLCSKTENDLLKVPNLGRKMVITIKEALALKGLSLKAA